MELSVSFCRNTLLLSFVFYSPLGRFSNIHCYIRGCLPHSNPTFFVSDDYFFTFLGALLRFWNVSFARSKRVRVYVLKEFYLAFPDSGYKFFLLPFSLRILNGRYIPNAIPLTKLYFTWAISVQKWCTATMNPSSAPSSLSILDSVQTFYTTFWWIILQPTCYFTQMTRRRPVAFLLLFPCQIFWRTTFNSSTICNLHT